MCFSRNPADFSTYFNLLRGQGPVAHSVDNATHRINHYPVDKCWQNKLHYTLDSDLTGG